MTEITYNETTGTFSLGDVKVCQGHHNTEVVVGSGLELQYDRTVPFTVTIAQHGTIVRVFSISEEDFSKLTVRPRYWKRTGDRVWFMATFKNLDGHTRHWKTKDNTFGKMFESIISPAGVQNVLEATSGSLCISYFIRHPDNDLFNEVTTPQVVMTIAWDSKNNRFISPFDLPSQTNIEKPMLVNLIDNTPNDPRGSGGTPVEDGFPLLVTMYFSDGSISNVKYITERDESIRRLRCRAHNRFAALFAAQQMLQQDPTNVDLQNEMKYAVHLFSQHELNQFADTVAAARTELQNDLCRKRNGLYVEFPNMMFQFCNIRNMIANSKTEAQLCNDVWNALCKCTDGKRIRAIEQFINVYGRIVE